MTRTTPKQRTREIWQKLSHLDSRPDQIAAGFSIGIFSGFLPLNPSPIIVGVAAEEERDSRCRRGDGGDSLYPAIAFDLAG